MFKSSIWPKQYPINILEKRHTIIIDIGNSRVKYYFAANTEYDIESVYLSLEPEHSHIIDVFVIAPKRHIGEKTMGKVFEFFLNLEMSVDEEDRTAVQVGRTNIFDPESDRVLEGTYKGLGGDRIAKLAGALALFPGQNIMLMDFGTATTLNLASPDGKFQGGFINLGLEASLKAVADQLRGFKDYSESKWFKSLLSGKAINEIFSDESTEQAVIEGAYREHLALINYYKNYALEKFNGEQFISVATGGNAGIFTAEFDKYVDSGVLLESFVDRYFALQGLKP